MSAITPLTNNSPSFPENRMANDSKVEKTAAEICAIVNKRKPLQTTGSNKSQKREHFKFSRQIEGLLGKKLSLDLETLSNELGREAKPDELLNFQMGRTLHAKICVNDPEIPFSYFINWKLLNSLGKLGSLLSPIRDQPVSSEALKDHRGEEIMQDDLKKTLKREPTFEELFNYKRGRPLSEPISAEAIDGYCDSHQISLFQGWTNFALDRDLSHPIREEDHDHPYWKVVVEICLKLPPDALVLKQDFEAVINRKVTPQEYINCMFGRRLTHLISVAEMELYLGRPLTSAEKSRHQQDGRNS